MRILLVTHRYPPLGVTGVERLSEQTAVGLAAAGHEVTVLTRHDAAAPPVPRLQPTTRNGINVVVVTGGGPLHGRFPKLGPTLERLFERTLLEANPDVVLISHLINHSPTYVSIAHHWRVPVVVELHDFFFACERAHLERFSGERCAGPEGGRACATHCYPDQSRALERWALRTHMFRQALQQADALTCPSNFVANYFRDTFGPLTPPLHLIGNGVELTGPARTTVRGADRPLHLACIGVVARHKGTHLVLDALRLARLPSARLSLFGEAYLPYYRGLARLASELENVEFHAYGRFEPIELPILLEDVDAVIIPSLVWESYSIVAREAMACGIPVIASRLGALPEAIRHGQNGLLFEPGSALDLATLLQMLDRDRERLDALRAGILRTDWISVQQRLERLEAVLDGVVAHNGAAGGAVPEFAELAILRDALLQVPAA
jgi:glycosyltransferase involved in cell wall biosynthesis